MNFLVVLAAWVVLQWRGPATALHRDRWVHNWFLRGAAALAPLPSAWQLGLIALLPALAAGLVAAALAPMLAGLPLFLFALAVLAYSLGRGDYRVRCEAYLQRWRRGDRQAAFEEAVALGIIAPNVAVADPAALHRSVRRALLYEGYERWFGVVFWFALLGPAGALGYRVLQLLRVDPHASVDEQAQLARWLGWADWLPVRLLGLTFALAGSFGDCFRYWLESWSSRGPAAETLDRFLRAALTLNEAAPVAGSADVDTDPDTNPSMDLAGWELGQMQALLARSAVGWLIALAVLQLV